MNIVLLTNILTPYRKAFFNEMYRQCVADGQSDFRVICMAAGESDRKWRYEDLRQKYTFLLKNKTIRLFHYDIHFCKGVEEMLLAANPDVIIVSGSYMLKPAWTAVKCAKEHGIKVLFWSESHLSESRGYRKALVEIREKIRERFYKKFDGFLYPGTKAKEFIEKYAKEGVSYYNIPNLINNRAFDIRGAKYSKAILRDKYGIAQGKYIFLSPIRLSKEKGMTQFLELLAKAKEYKRCQVAIAGEGELKDEIIDKAKLLDIDLVMLGYREQSEMIELYRCADCFLLPSFADPNPLTCIEALWNGLPLLVSEHVGNHPEVVKQGQNGFVFSYAREDEAAHIIDSLIMSDGEFRYDAANISYDIATKNFELKDRTGRLIKELKSSL